MARINLRLPMQRAHPVLSSLSVSSLIVLLVIISVFSIVTFLCGKPTRGNNAKTERLGERRAGPRLQSNISSKAQFLAKMIAWKKVEDEGKRGHYDNDEDEAAIWKKTIIQGDKCRPLEFSGKILYDANGNQIPDSPGF